MRIRLATVVKLLGFTLGGLMAVLVALILLVWISFDADRTVASLTRHFQHGYERTLKLASEPSLKLWPRPTLVLRGITLSEAGRADIFASATELRADLALLPLLMHRTEFRRVAIEGAQIQLRYTQEGRWNIADLLAPANSASAADSLNLHGLSLQGSSVVYEDVPAARRMELRDMNFLADDIAADTASDVALRARWLDIESASDARLTFKAKIQFQDGLRDTVIDALQANLEGDAATMQKARLHLAATRVGWHKSGQQGELSHVTARLTGARGTQSIELSGELPTLTWQDDIWRGERSAARLVLRTPSDESALALELGALKSTAEGAAAPIDLKWENKAMAGSGQFKALLVLEPKLGKIRIDDFKGSARRAPSKGEKLRNETHLSGRGHWFLEQQTKDRGTLELGVTDGTDSLRLRSNLERLAPLRGSVKVESPRLNADRIFTPANRDTLGAWVAPIAAKAQFDAQLDLLNLRLAGVRIDALRAPLRIEQGRVSTSKGVLRMYGGTAEFDAAADLPAGKLSARGEYRGIDFAGFARDSRLPFCFVGDQSGSFDLSASHQGGAADLASLHGALRWAQKGGALQGIDLTHSLREFRAAVRNKSAISRQGGNRESTELEKASGRYLFDQGKMRAERIEANNKWLSFSGPTTVDLAQGEVDALFGLRVKNSHKDFAELRGASLALHLLGPVRRPHLQYAPPATKAARK